ncbi:ribonuclease Z [Thermoflavimicrobium daqui]|uniref:Ribonuclease Z n=1 Tax=Thermoflavimicrobium daqui TaxID=2137476 RepID=A0A364K9H5_9BACL|nr:ribonuclease Z [Thermoflavimicrobium daqui]RAL26951.1 ribonuclease Z [Thermoflavimicrobium daqui]
MEYIFLGTGAGIPSTTRNVSSAALVLPEYQGETWLFDCGEATQHQILTTSITLSKIRRIFITHLHGDHIFGLPGVLGSRSFQGAETPLTIYGPKGILSFIEITLKTSQTYLRYPLEIIEIEDGMEIKVPHFRIKVALLEHGIPSFGYRIVEEEKPGSLQVDKLKALGISPGPIYQKIKAGELITLNNGTQIHGADFLNPPKKGKKITVLGDTRPTASLNMLVQEADLLIHESTFRKGMEEKAKKHFHSTNIHAAQLAKDAKVKNLILTHFSARFLEEECNELLSEAREIFPQTWLAYDGFCFTIK